MAAADEAKLPAFKMLTLKAADKVAKGAATFGGLADGRHGHDALTRAADYPAGQRAGVKIGFCAGLGERSHPACGVSRTVSR